MLFNQPKLTSEKHAAMQHSINRLLRDINSSTWLIFASGIRRKRSGLARFGGIASASVGLMCIVESVFMMMRSPLDDSHDDNEHVDMMMMGDVVRWFSSA